MYCSLGLLWSVAVCSCNLCWRHSHGPTSVTDRHLTEINSVRYLKTRIRKHTRPMILTVVSKLKNFLRSRSKVVISWKWCKVLLQTANWKWYMVWQIAPFWWPVRSLSYCKPFQMWFFNDFFAAVDKISAEIECAMSRGDSCASFP